MGTPGRPPKVRFPIIRALVINGIRHTATVKENAQVHCLLCGEKFHIAAQTVTRHKDPDDMPIVICPRCRYRAAVVHYYSQAAEIKEDVNDVFPVREACH